MRLESATVHTLLGLIGVILLNMNSSKPRQAIQVTRLGRSDVEGRVRQAAANIRLEGYEPSARSQALVREVASGKKTHETALAEIRSWYVRP